jgi:hypothetical protein
MTDKMKYFLLIIGVLLVAGGVWFGRAAWRAHKQLVTLDVRDVPLPEVLRKIEWQTWQKMRAEKSLDGARITLRVKNKPLSFVLDRIAGQAGAHWSKLYAVYDSSVALHALNAALRGDGNLAPAGWTKVAPELPTLKPPGGIPAGAQPQRGQMMLVRRTQSGPVFFESGPGGQTQEWSAEELVMESSLSPRLSGEHIQTATAATALAVAQKVNGHWTTYFAFSKSIVGVGIAGISPMMSHFGSTPMMRGTNGVFYKSKPGQTNFQFPVAPPINPNERFANLTPQERVQQARMRQEFKNFQSSNHVQSPFPP